jgi:hypothetical protein
MGDVMNGGPEKSMMWREIRVGEMGRGSFREDLEEAVIPQDMTCCLHALPGLAEDFRQVVLELHIGIVGRGTLQDHHQVRQKHPTVSVA